MHGLSHFTVAFNIYKKKYKDYLNLRALRQQNIRMLNLRLQQNLRLPDLQQINIKRLNLRLLNIRQVNLRQQNLRPQGLFLLPPNFKIKFIYMQTNKTR